MRSTTRSAAAGAAAAGLALAVTEFVAALSSRVPSLLDAVATWIINTAPRPVVHFATSTFGTSDKQALLIGTIIVSVVVGAVASTRRQIFGPALMAAGAAGIAAAVGHTNVSAPLTTLTVAIGVGAGIAARAWLLRARPHAKPAQASDVELRTRREFVTLAAGVTVGAALVGTMGRTIARGGKAAAARARIVLPRVTRAATAVDNVAQVNVRGITPLITSNERFYRIDTAIVAPDVNVETWRLHVRGLVDRPYSLSFDELLAMATTQAPVTLACVSNELGGVLASTAVWQGVPVDALLRRAGVKPGADQLVGRSVDGFTAGFPISAVGDGRTALVAVGMNGEPLPVRHGFPARLVVAGLYGYVSATKWLSDLVVTTFDDASGFWVDRGWAQRAPIKTMSRIDVPRKRSLVAAGPNVIAGMAWAPTIGIDRVEVRVDGGEWMTAELAGELTDETWRQWKARWDATPGDHIIEARATDRSGYTQTAERQPPFPDGATGYHRVAVTVGKP